MVKTLVVIFLVLFLNLSLSYAQNPQNPTLKQDLPKVEGWEIDESLVRLSPIRFLPDHPLYFLISLKEKFDHFTKPDKTKKALFDTHLSGKKIKEAYLLSQKNNFGKASHALKEYQKVSGRLREELTQAANQGLPVFETEAVLANSLERHLKIIVIMANNNSEQNFRQESAKSVEAVKLTAKLLEKHLPDAAQRILDFASKIKIS